MKGTVKQIVAVATVAIYASAVGADNRHITQDQLEDTVYGVGVSESAGEPYGRLLDDRRHYGDLLYNVHSSEQPSEYQPYVRVEDDRDYSEDLVYGSPGFEQQGGLGHHVAGQ